MDANGHRFDEGAEFEVEAGGDFDDFVGRDFDVFGHAAVAVDADEFEGVADVRGAVLAGFALAAGEQRVDGDRGAFGQGGMPGFNHAGEFVAHDQRRLSTRVGALVDEHIGAADAGIRDFDQHFACSRGRHRFLFRHHLPGPFVNDALHRLSPVTTC